MKRGERLAGPRCSECSDRVSPGDMTDGLCPPCYTGGPPSDPDWLRHCACCGKRPGEEHEWRCAALANASPAHLRALGDA